MWYNCLGQELPIIENKIQSCAYHRLKISENIMKETVISMKKVYCLYRVSTMHQVEYSHDGDGDIPMQKTACHEFASRQDQWVITKEFYEKGISGYKVSAEDRDAIQDLKRAAEQGEFDVLLVFKFDRLGRIESETPFILEWFVSHGIEMWSTKEGQQKIETRTDKLINFLRFWQAGTESENTSQRVSTAMRQMVSIGRYVGGVTPFGYHTVKSGEKNKRGKELLILEKDIREADAVRMIFEKTVIEGYGSYRMSKLLNDMGYRMHSGAKFQCTSVNRILSNPIYCGFIKFGDVISPRKEELQIVDDDIFEQAQYILEQRAEKEADKRHIAMNTKGHTLLSGNIFCAHCGSHMVASSWWDNYTRKDGTEVRQKRFRYLCYHKSRKLNDCDGPSAYTSEKIDEAISELVRQYLDCLIVTPRTMAVEKRYRHKISELNDRKRSLEKENARIDKQLAGLTAEVAKSIAGESRFDADTLSIAITNAKNEMNENRKNIAVCTSELEKQKELLGGIGTKYDLFRSWADLYDKATPEIKKMIVCRLIQRIEIGKGYELTVYFNPSFLQFLGKEAEDNVKIVLPKVV